MTWLIVFFISANHDIFWSSRAAINSRFQMGSATASSWEDICVDWALRNPNEPMHWHHLVPEKQKSYDLASRDGKIRDLRSLETHLDLREHEDANGHPLRLREMVEWY